MGIMNKYQWAIVVLWTMSIVISDLQWLASQSSGTVLGFIIGAGGAAVLAVLLLGIPVKWGWRKVQERRLSA
jgi:hypothetical protein